MIKRETYYKALVYGFKYDLNLTTVMIFKHKIHTKIETTP